MSIRVRAKEKGFFDGARYREGQEFVIDDIKSLGKWMEVIELPKAAQPETVVDESDGDNAPTPEAPPVVKSIPKTTKKTAKKSAKSAPKDTDGGGTAA